MLAASGHYENFWRCDCFEIILRYYIFIVDMSREVMLKNESFLGSSCWAGKKKDFERHVFLLTTGIVFVIYPLLFDATKFERWSLKTE